MLKDELEMLCGVSTSDMDYIGYLLLKDGIFFKDKQCDESDELTPIVNKNVTTVVSLEDWFSKI